MKKLYTPILSAVFCVSGLAALAQTTQTFNYTGSLQTFTIPACCSSITIEAYGAQGGNASYNNTPQGGLGAYIKGTFSVTPGQVLNIMVGQMGLNGTGGCGDLNGGGGGGSFVWDPTNTTNPWIAAGGGAGSGSCGYSVGQPGQATLGGTGLGGDCGSGPCNNGNGTGGGGAGWNGGGNGCRSNGNCGAMPGAQSPLSGGTGGTPWIGDCYQNGAGGYGGGGAGGGNCGGPGGGGGYTGGRGGGNTLVGGCTNDIAYGGLSYNAGTAQTNTTGLRSGNGMVVITYTAGAPANAGAITGSANVCAGSSGNYSISTVSGATTYSWTVPTGAVINSGQGTTSINVTFGSTSGTISVTPSNSCGSGAAANLSVTVNAVPVVSLGSDITQCGGSVNLDAGNPGATYLWSDNSTSQMITVSSSGTYSVVVTDANGCTGTDAINVTVNTPPTVALGNDITQCGGSVNLDAGNPGATYLWSDNSTSQMISVSASGTYSVLVTDANGCTGTDAINVTINTPPTVALGSDITQCGGTVNLDAGNPGATYLWSDNSTTQMITVSATGTYSVVVTDANGCTGTDAIDVTINAIPNVTLTLSPTTVCITIPSYALTGGSPSGGAYSGNGVSGGNFDPNAAGLGTHTILYVYTDSNGCVDSASQNITVDACVGIYSNGPADGFDVYPNPAEGAFFISSAGTMGKLSIVLCDVQGRIVYSSETPSMTQGDIIQVNISGFAEGVYTLKLISENNMSIRKVVIRK